MSLYPQTYDTLPYISSKSKNMIETTPILITEHSRYRILFKFEYDNVNNTSLRGHFIFLRRKGKNDEWPTETTYSRGDIPNGARVDFELKSEELEALFNHVEKIKTLFEKTNESNYRAVDQFFSKEDLLLLLNDNWVLSGKEPELHQLLCQLLDGSIQIDSEMLKILSNEKEALGSLISKFGKLSELDEALKPIPPQSLELIQNAANVINLINLKDEIDRRLTEKHDERSWHHFISNNHLILSQLFVLPVVLFEDEAKIGGGDFHSTGGVCDYLYKSKITGNITLIEIKSPNTKLMVSNEYRRGIETFAATTDLSGAVIQVNQYRTTLTKEYYQRRNQSNGEFETLNPQCIVLAGTLSSLNEKGQRESFELFRNSLTGTTVMTYDELSARIQLIIDFIESSSSSRDQ